METIRKYAESSHTSLKYAVGEIDIYGNVFHNCHELYFLLNGDVEFISSYTRQTIHPGQLVLIPAGEYHQFLVHSDIQTYERCVLDVWPDFLPEDILHSILAVGKLFALPADHRIVTHIQYLIQSLSACSKEDFSCILPAVVTDILFLIKNSSRMETLSPGKLRPVSLQIMEILDAHYREPLSLEEIAGKCFLSVSSVSHIFKEDFGISIKKYILQKRMIGAQRALMAGMGSKEVSLAYGFAEYSAFYRAYKQYYGVAPSHTENEQQ